MGTHLIISQNIIDSLDPKSRELISEKNFKYGNIKPDILSKYKLKKHYLDESYDMIENKINSMCSIDPETLAKTYNNMSFNQELGVICHFLCDFFCLAHSERWEFKHSFKQHVKYERDLLSKSKEFRFDSDRQEIKQSFKEFFFDLYDEYKRNQKSEENDLMFAAYVCKCVINYIFDRIFSVKKAQKIILATV